MASETHHFLMDLASAAGLAALIGMVAHALKQPRILGYLAAGLIIGPYIPIPLLADADRIHTLAEFGVVLVMFAVGLEFRISKLMQVLPVSGFAGIVQVGFMMWAGFTLGTLLGWGSTGAVFLGAALATSSTMVVTSIFGQVQVEDDVRQSALGILVFQDVAAIALITAMTALAAGQELGAWDVAVVVAQLAGVLVGMLGVGMLIIPRLVRFVLGQGGNEGIAVLSVGLAFGMAVLASELGYSAALGAFVAGILVAESGRGHEVEHLIEPLKHVFAAIFFVSIGMAVEPWAALTNLPIALLVAGVVIGAQLVAVTVGSLLSGSPLCRAVKTGFALGQIGEFSFIIATIGATAGVAPPELLPILVTVAAITSFTTAQLVARAPAFVDWLDNRLPDRLQHFLTLYQTWLDRLREGGTAPFSRALMSMAFDVVGLLILAAVSVNVHDPASLWLQEEFELGPSMGFLLVNLATVLLMLPLLIGLLRNARALARLMVVRLVPGDEARQQPVVQLIKAISNLLVVLGVGMPAVALLRPLVGGPWGEPFLLWGLTVAVVSVWRRMGAVEGEFRSGTEQVAGLVARRAGTPAATQPVVPELPGVLPGLDQVELVELTAGTFAVGRTLADLHLRARTGATVLFIHRQGGDVMLPTGHDRCAQGDLVALTGSKEAIEQARALLKRGEALEAREAS